MTHGSDRFCTFLSSVRDSDQMCTDLSAKLSQFARNWHWLGGCGLLEKVAMVYCRRGRVKRRVNVSGGSLPQEVYCGGSTHDAAHRSAALRREGQCGLRRALDRTLSHEEALCVNVCSLDLLPLY